MAVPPVLIRPVAAVDEQDTPVGLANLRWFARPSTGALGLYLDDPFTAPETGSPTTWRRAA